MNKDIEKVLPDNITFTGIIKSKLSQLSKHNLYADTEPLVSLDYSKELEIKNDSLKEYCKIKDLPFKPGQIKPSPKNRFYRTTSKRRIINKNGGFFLLFGEGDSLPDNSYYRKSLLEPEEHASIYNFLSDTINTSQYKIVGLNLNYIIIRGNYSEFSIIFNVHKLNAAIVRKLKSLGDLLKEIPVNIISAFIYLDPTRSEYYLENERPADVLNFKKLFGPDKIFLKINDKKYSFHPTAFSQVNESMIPIILNEAKRLLHPSGRERFVDLYCGYGLFSLYLAESFQEVIGVEWEGEAINSAIHNAAFSKDKNRIKFFAKKISGSNLNDILPAKKTLDEYFLLDPPRQGTDQGVIKTIASRQPGKILHIFCGIERIRQELHEWKKYDYKVREIIPLDMFPGTPNLEIMFLLEQNRR